MSKRNFVCSNCGSIHSKWAGKCEDCNEWNSIVEDTSSNDSFTKLKKSKDSSKNPSIIEIHNLEDNINIVDRKETGISELDRVLGGGLVEGSATLLGGEPGIGKSTLLLQIAVILSRNNFKALYITGEESVSQVSLRARRLGLEKSPLMLASATNVSKIIQSIKKNKPDFVIIDSIQTMYLDNIESAPGTVSQVRFSAHELINLAKNVGFSLIIVGHITKDGQIAGPKVLEHMVDTVLYFEGDKGYNYRILRAVKNRFGPANEIGVFEMQEKGLVEVTNPSSLFIQARAENTSGSVIYAGIEGTRPIMVEVQALVSPSFMATPRRAVVGWDNNRLAVILAVLQTRCGLKLQDKEVYLNIAGGIKINEPAADLAVALAIISALGDNSIPSDLVVFGEVGLSGEVRPVSKMKARLDEAVKLGFTRAITPKQKEKIDLETKEVKHIADILQILHKGFG